MARPGRPSVVHRGIILQLRNVGEGHRLVDAWLERLGRTPLWARSARASKRRFGGVLMPFADVSFTVEPDKSLWRLRAADLCDARLGIRATLAGMGRAAGLCRVVQALWPEGQDAPEVYRGLTLALDHVAQGRPSRAAGLYPRLALYSGVLPSLEHCGRCQASLGDGPAFAPSTLSHLLCGRCAARGKPLTPAALVGLRGGRIEEPAAAAEVEAVVMNWVSAFAGKTIAPWRPDAALPDGP